MKIEKLNYLLQEIYMKDYDNFYKLYNSYSKFVLKKCINKYKDVQDKNLYTIEDLKQEFWLFLLEDLKNHLYIFNNNTQFSEYIDLMVTNVIIKINNNIRS